MSFVIAKAEEGNLAGVKVINNILLVIILCHHKYSMDQKRLEQHCWRRECFNDMIIYSPNHRKEDILTPMQ